MEQINAPWAFTTVWSFVKSLLDEVTVGKIQILGSDYIKVLAQQIPLENIPQRIGGKCQCPGGCELSNEGPWQNETLVKRVQEKQAREHQVTENGDKNALDEKKVEQKPAAVEAASVPASTAAITAPAATYASHSEKPIEDEVAVLSVSDGQNGVPRSTSQIQMTVVESKVDS